MDVARYGARVWVGAVEWVGGIADWTERALWVSTFVFCFFFLPLHPAPRSLLLITDGPPLTMPCHACKMQEQRKG